MIAALALAMAMTIVHEPLQLVNFKQFRRDHRLLVISVPGLNYPEADDSAVKQQLWLLAKWKRAAYDRDVRAIQCFRSFCESLFDSVEIADSARVHRLYGLRHDRFEVLLMGKDGHVALRSRKPLTGEKLQAVIDAMPMRRAGLR